MARFEHSSSTATAVSSMQQVENGALSARLRLIALAWIVSALWAAVFVLIASTSKGCASGSSWWADHIACLQLNEIGDLAAGLFAPLAFIWFLTAVFLQKAELELTRSEFRLNREVAERQRTEFEQQTRFMEEANKTALRNMVLTYKLNTIDQWVEVYQQVGDALAALRDGGGSGVSDPASLNKAKGVARMLGDEPICEGIDSILADMKKLSTAQIEVSKCEMERRAGSIGPDGPIVTPDDAWRARKASADKALSDCIDEVKLKAKESTLLSKITAKHLSSPQEGL